MPVADPNIFSTAQRIAIAQTSLQLVQSNPQVHGPAGMYEAYKRMYEALGVRNIEKVLPPPPQPQPQDPAIENAKAIKETETQLRKQLAQLRMARYTLIAMGEFTFDMFFFDVERVKALADISNLFYLSGAGIVGAYMGTTAWMNKK